MARDYFEDITPPQNSGRTRQQPVGARRPVAPAPEPVVDLDESDDDLSENVPIKVTQEQPRGIRSIAPSRTRIEMEARDASSFGGSSLPPKPKGNRRRWWLWGAAIVLVLALVVLALVALRPTTVTVTPRSQALTFTPADQFTAYPALTAATGTLSYTVETIDLQDSDTVPSTGTTTVAAAKASGSITVYNAYSASSVKLIKNTRFEDPNGLIFRTPDDIVIPGEKAGVPGKVTVTVIADQTGDQYNIGPTSKFTVPGLQSNAAMYAKVYASSGTAMTGGSSGSNGPGVDPAVLSGAVSDLQTKLQTKAEDAAAAQAGSGMMVIPGLMQITYTEQPTTPASGGDMQVNESAHVQVPVFPSLALGEAVGSVVSADAADQPMTITPGTGFGAQVSGTPDLGTDAINFTLTGQAQLIWSVDTNALATALAGKDASAFETVVNGFSGIEEAHAKVEPFWKNTFPSDPSDIHVTVTAPQSTQ